MTDDAPKPGHEEELAPPASTRWAEDDVPEDDGLAPPFVPGRTQASGPGAAEADVVEEGPQVGQERSAQPTPPPLPDEDDFPFDQFDIEGDETEDEAEPEAEPESEPLAPGAWDTGSKDWTPAELASEEEARLSESAAESSTPETPISELSTPEPSTPDVSDDRVWSPADLDVDEEGVPEGPVTPATPVEADEADESDETAEAVAPAEAGAPESSPAEEVAALLDRLARSLREEGPDAIRAEMDSSDQLTSLLAGLLAGYVSGRS